jgi:hypothetical protein
MTTAPIFANARLTVEEAHARRGYKNFVDLLIGFRDLLPATAPAGR